MAYTPTTWTNGVTPANQTNMNHLETQYTEASLSFNPDLFTAGFVLTGLVATKDGSVANQLDVTAGTAYLLQSADNTVRQRKPASSNQTTSALSSTYNLYLQPDGTWYWSTSNAPAANSLYVAQVTTDGSGNISTVTDKRVQAIYLFNAQNANTGATGLPAAVVLHQLALDASALGANLTGAILYYDPLKAVAYNSPAHGASGIGHYFATWDGAVTHTPFSVGGQFGGALAWVDNSGGYHIGGGGLIEWLGSPTFLQRFHTVESGSAAGQVFFSWDGSANHQVLGIGTAAWANGNPVTALADDGHFLKVATLGTAGAYGVPIVIAQATDVSVTGTALTTICSATTPNDGKNHQVRLWVAGNVGGGNTNNGTCSLAMAYTDPGVGAVTAFNFPYYNGAGLVPASSITITKGGAQFTAAPYVVICGPNATVAVKYQNSAAGTISDKASGIIEILG